MKTQATKLRMLMTAAVFIGGTAIAAAQTPQTPSGGAAPSAGQTEQKGSTGGAMTHQPSSAQSGEKAPGATGERSAQSPNQGARTGQATSPSEKNEKSSQSGTKEMNTQRGAEEEHGAKQKGAQEERNERGAQTESGKAGVKTQENAQGGTRGGTSVQGSATTNSRGASVQLSQDQRTRIHGVIGKSSSTARISGRPDFDVSVGVRVPHSVHVAVLPEDVITIVPQYRGFDYVMVGDQILIIDPSTYEIVAVIEA
jgi:hypothetical protein